VTIVVTDRALGDAEERGPGIRSVGEHEIVIDVSGRKNNLGELVHHGRVRLYAQDGSIAEISHPTREAWRDPEGWYHVQLSVKLADVPRPPGFHSGPLPEGAQTPITSRDIVQVGSELFGGVVFDSSARIGYGLGPVFSDIVLRDIQRVEIVVPRASSVEVRRLIGRVARSVC